MVCSAVKAMHVILRGDCVRVRVSTWKWWLKVCVCQSLGCDWIGECLRKLTSLEHHWTCIFSNPVVQQ
jgi:hypothetical protein